MRGIRYIIGAGMVASLLVVFSGAVPGTAPSLASAQEAPRYGRLPIMERDWTRFPAGPAGEDPLAREMHRQSELTRRWHEVHEVIGERHISRRSMDLLRQKGLGPALVDGTAGAAKAGTPEDPVTLKVLIIRIGYDANSEPELNSMVPDGGFDMTVLPTREDTLYVDPSPRGRAFFESHLQGLKEFYSYQSGGRLIIEGTVLPRQEDRWYTLSDIADYGPGTDGYWNLDEDPMTPGNVERYMRDMIVAADEGTQADHVTDPEVPLLADHDDDNDLTYIIFVHAGSDWQSDLNADSPNDPPTFFMTLGEPQDLTSRDSGNGSLGRLSEFSLIPETTNQDDYAGSIAAAFYHEFGHALGLPDVYDTGTFYPSVGLWDLMDSGTNLPVPLGFINTQGDTIRAVATGVLPPSIGAWNKWYLGWLSLGRVEGTPADGASYRLPAVQVPLQQYSLYHQLVSPNFVNANLPRNHDYYGVDAYQAMTAGISEHEWFLLENRWVPTGPGETPYDQLKFERDPATGVILYLAGERVGQWSNSGYYDYFLPAGGLLVWHVNMARIAEGMATNQINADGDGLRLVEADGIQDIGVTNAYVLGWYGSALDPFYGREGDTGLLNGYNSLFVEGYPNSRCFDRSWTGFHFEEVGPAGRTPAVLRVPASVDPVLRGFPWSPNPVDTTEVVLPEGVSPARGIDPISLTTVDIAVPPLEGEFLRSVLIFADAAPEGADPDTWRAGLHSLTQDAVKKWLAFDWIQDLTKLERETQFAELTAPLAGPPVAWSLDDGTGRLLVGDTAGVVSLWSLERAGNDPPDELWIADFADPLPDGPQLLHLDGEPAAVACYVAPDRVIVLDLADGSPMGQPLVLSDAGLGAVEASVGRGRLLPAESGWDAWIVATDAGWFRCTVGVDGAEAATARAWPDEPRGPVHTVAVGTAESAVYAAYDDRGLLRCWDHTGGAREDLFAAEEALVTEPAVADLDGDGGQDVVLATATRILAWRGDGAGVRGFPAPLYDMFPVAATTRITGPLIVADSDGNGVDDVLFGTDGGHLFQLGPGAGLHPQSPYRWGDGTPSGFAVTSGDAEDGRRVLWLVSQGGRSSGPLDELPLHGRLAAYRMAPPADAERRTSEWLGPGGGTLRRGPVGTARHLGDASPLAYEFDRPLVYPNPLREADLTVRFYSEGSDPAEFAIYNLEGEVVTRQRIEVAARTLNEHIVPLPTLASGMYVCRLQWDAPGGRRTKMITLAVEK